MSYDGKLLARARKRLDGIRAENEAEQARRLAEAYALRPEIRRCDAELRSHMTEIVRLTLSHADDVAARIDELREKNLSVRAMRSELLRSIGRDDEWLEEIYSCPKCRDSGVYGGGVCTCLDRLYNEELTKELGALMKTGGERFEDFDLSLYDASPIPGGSVVPRERMKKLLEIAKRFAADFPDTPYNLLLQGGTGLGKTFLSACIARAVADKGCSVCYDTAAAAVGSFEKQKFDRSEEADERVGRMLSCDLMILDDLGTEMPTPMAQSAIYTLINTRLVNGKKTVVSTNLGFEEIERRYGAQTLSRLRGDFETLPFVGKDIRLLRKRRQSE